MLRIIRNLIGGPIYDPKWSHRKRIFLKLYFANFTLLYNTLLSAKPLERIFNYKVMHFEKPKPIEGRKFQNVSVISCFSLIKIEDSEYYPVSYEINPSWNLSKIESRMRAIFDKAYSTNKSVWCAFTCQPYNFYHFMTDFIIPYLSVQNEKEPLFLPFSTSKKQKEILDFFNIPFINCNFQANHHFDQVKILPSIFSGDNEYEPWPQYSLNLEVIRNFQSNFILNIKDNRNVKIFVSRKNASRKPKDLEKIELIFRNRGWIVYNSADFTFEESVTLFAKAKIVLGIHGAGMTNIIFCDKNTAIKEIIPKQFKNQIDPRPVFENLSKAMGLNYSKEPEPLNLEDWKKCIAKLG